MVAFRVIMITRAPRVLAGPFGFQAGFTLIELLLAVALIGVVAAIAIPGLLNARGNSQEASIVAGVRGVFAAQSAYAFSCADGYFAPSLARLGTQPADGSAPFVDADLAVDPATKGGYRLTLTAGAPVADAPASCNGAAAGEGVRTYWLSADPIHTGPFRHFGGNQGGTLYQSTAAIAPTQNGAPPGATAD